MKNFKSETCFDSLYSNYLSEVKIEKINNKNNSTDEKETIPFVGNLFYTYRERIEKVIQLIVGNLVQAKIVLENYEEFKDVFSGKFKEENQILRNSGDLKNILECYKKIKKFDLIYQNLPSSCIFKMFEVNLKKLILF